MSLLGGIELAPLSLAFKVDIKGFKSDMDKVKTEAVTKSKEVAKQMESTIKVGDKMSKLGSTMTKTLTLPIVGAGTAITKMAVDFESSFAKVSTLLDRNIVNYDEYKQQILDASSESKIAVGEFSEAVYQSISAGVDQTKAIEFTTEAMKLAKGGFTDGAKAVDVLTTAINVYGMSAEDVTRVSDILINTQNLGKTTVDELASSIGMVLPITAQLNMSFEDTMAVMATLTKNGIGTSQAVTGLKAALSNIVKPTTEASDAAEILGIDFSAAALQSEGLIPFLEEIKESMKSAAPDFAKMSEAVCDNYKEMQRLEEQGKKNTDQYKQLKKCTNNMEKDMEILAQASDSAISGFATLFGSVEGLNSMMVLTSETGAKDLQNSMDAMYNSAGSAQEAFDKMDATPAEQLKGALNELKNAGIKLGTKLIPVVTKIADKISDLVDWFNELSPAQQENILKMGAMVAAAGPLLKVTGNLVSTYGKLKPAIKGLSTYFKGTSTAMGGLGTEAAKSGGLMGKLGGQLAKVTGVTKLGASGIGGMAASLGAVAVPAAAAVAAGAALYTVYKGFTREVIPEVDLFKGRTVASLNEVTGKTEYTSIKISEETQKQVQAYMDLSKGVQQESTNMYTGVTQITEKNISNITSKVKGMADTIITASKTQRDKTIQEYEAIFSKATYLTDDQKNKVLSYVNAECEERIKKVESTRDRLTEIYTEINKNGGEITKDMQTELNECYAQMQEFAIESMAQSKAEQETILHNLKNSREGVDADMAGGAIKKMNEIRDNSVAAAQEEHDKVVAIAMRMKESKEEGAEETADAMIKAADKEYEGIVRAAELTRSEGIDKLMRAYPELAKQVSVNTGEVVSHWEQMLGGLGYEQWDGGVKTFMLKFETTGLDKIDLAMEKTRLILNGTHYNGLDYVPFDGYNARLHKGERVLTKKENEAYTKAKQESADTKGIILNVNSPKALNPSETAERIRIMMQELALGV